MVILFLRTYKKVGIPLLNYFLTFCVAGYPSVHEIEYAILEANGAISILPKRELVPLTPKDLNIDVKYAGLPIALIVDSQIQYDNLKLIHKDEKWLYKELKEKGITNIKNVAFASVQETDGSLLLV